MTTVIKEYRLELAGPHVEVRFRQQGLVHVNGWVKVFENSAAGGDAVLTQDVSLPPDTSWLVISADPRSLYTGNATAWLQVTNPEQDSPVQYSIIADLKQDSENLKTFTVLQGSLAEGGADVLDIILKFS